MALQIQVASIAVAVSVLAIIVPILIVMPPPSLDVYVVHREGYHIHHNILTPTLLLAELVWRYLVLM